MERVIGFLVGLVRGAGLLIRDAHRALHRRFDDRVWWGYFAAFFLLYLWKSGQLWDVAFNLLTLGIVLIGLRIILSPLFERGRRRR